MCARSILLHHFANYEVCLTTAPHPTLLLVADAKLKHLRDKAGSGLFWVACYESKQFTLLQTAFAISRTELVTANHGLKPIRERIRQNHKFHVFSGGSHSHTFELKESMCIITDFMEARDMAIIKMPDAPADTYCFSFATERLTHEQEAQSLGYWGGPVADVPIIAHNAHIQLEQRGYVSDKKKECSSNLFGLATTTVVLEGICFIECQNFIGGPGCSGGPVLLNGLVCGMVYCQAGHPESPEEPRGVGVMSADEIQMGISVWRNNQQ